MPGDGLTHTPVSRASRPTPTPTATDDVLAGLSDAQVAAVTTTAAPLAIVAGPGSGKTRVLTRRVAYRCLTGDAEPAHTLVVTFSRRAASELLDRLARLGLPVGARQSGVTAGTFHALAFAELSRHRAERGLPAVRVLGRPARLIGPALAGVLGRDPFPDELTDVAGRISRGEVDDPVVSATAAAYVQAKRTRRVLDLDDLLADCARLLTEDDEAGRAARWRHRHVFVDEYQDLNPAHRRLLNAWVGHRPDVCIVGDPDQAIYGFNGASPDLFERVTQDWPQATIVTLSDNFRSTPEIVALATAVRGSGGVSRRPPGPVPTVTAHTTDLAEAAAVAEAISARRVPGSSWSGVAVLARTNARLRMVASALDQLCVPWRLRDPRPLADRPAVRAWLSAVPDKSPVADLGEHVAEDAVVSDGAALIRAVAEFRAVAPMGTVGGFASWLDATGVTADEGDGTGVDLATFHRAKGLEWPAVWVIGVEDGLVPLAGADVAEEQRLLYVALTRASDELSVSWTGRRGRSGCRRSPWIDDIERARAALASEPAPAVQRLRFDELLRGLKAS